MTSLKHPPLSVRDAAIFLGLPPSTVYSAIARGELPHMRVGKRILISVTVLERLLGEGRNQVQDHSGCA